MNNKLYDKFLYSLNKEIRYVINEQFNIGNMDLNSKSKHNVNIFNKNIPDYYGMYNKILKNEILTDIEIRQLNDAVSVIKPKSKKALINIVEYYNNKFPNESLNWLDVSMITNMSGLFAGADDMYHDNFIFNNYNGDISQWDVSNVTDMSSMFNGSYFNNNIGQWDVRNVKNMCEMFEDSFFNQDISEWNVSNVRNMTSMFRSAEFNKDISRWNVSRVYDMSYMFMNSKFNQDISGWDVSHVTSMFEMFYRSQFNRDISGWNVYKVKQYDFIFFKCSIKENFKPAKFRNI